jgi:hypothetical protein
VKEQIGVVSIATKVTETKLFIGNKPDHCLFKGGQPSDGSAVTVSAPPIGIPPKSKPESRRFALPLSGSGAIAGPLPRRG